MIRNARQSRSLNDLTSLEETDSVLSVSASTLTHSWSFSNLLPQGEDDDHMNDDKNTGKVNGDDQEKRKSTRNVKPRSLLHKFQLRLADQVEQALRGGEESLEELFYNISGTVPVNVAQKLHLDMDRRWYYYELLATYYYQSEKHEPGLIASEILPLCSRLWSIEHFPAIFALLFHRWLVETEAGQTGKGWVMRFNVFLKGTYQLFWFDIQHDTHKLWPLFVRLRDHMFAVSSPFFDETSIAKESIRKDFACVLCRFYYYYTTRPERVGNFCINQLQLEDGLDTFVPQLVQQLRAIRSESVLKRYLKSTSMLPVDSLNLSSKNKLYATLNELHLPGAPLHPTPKTREQAELSMNKLFPQGRWLRYVINMFFKLLRPIYLPRTIFGFVTSLFQRQEAPTKNQ